MEVRYNMPSNITVHKVGANNINIKIQIQEKCRISVILEVSVNGEKLRPYSIFKELKMGYL